MRNAAVQVKRFRNNSNNITVIPYEFGIINQCIRLEEERIKNTDPNIIKNECSGYQGAIEYYGLDFAIEFCNQWFSPVSKLSKLYFDKLYIYALRNNRLYELQNINSKDLSNSLYSKIGADAQVAKNIKEIYLDRILNLIKENKYNEAINSIIAFTSVFSHQKVKVKK